MSIFLNFIFCSLVPLNDNEVDLICYTENVICGLKKVIFNLKTRRTAIKDYIEVITQDKENDGIDLQESTAEEAKNLKRKLNELNKEIKSARLQLKHYTSELNSLKDSVRCDMGKPLKLSGG